MVGLTKFLSHMAELQWDYGYYAPLLVMAIACDGARAHHATGGSTIMKLDIGVRFSAEERELREAGLDDTIAQTFPASDSPSSIPNPRVSIEFQTSDERFMEFALALAAEAARCDEVPIGAVVVLDDRLIGEGFNQPITTHDPTAHAEIVALRDAAKRLGNYRLIGATVYVTIEPCQMCVGAMVHARIARLVYGAREPKAGAIESAMSAHEHPALNHRMTAIGGVLEEKCRATIQEFFEARRSRSEG